VKAGEPIDGVAYEVGAEAVVVRSCEPLTVLSSAVAGGGLTTARTIVNLHVAKNWQPAPRGAITGWTAALDDFVVCRALPMPYVGLCTSAWTEHAEVAFEADVGLGVLVLASVGLGNPIAAGFSRAAAGAMPSTINTIVVVDALAPPVVLVNLVITVTEVKTAVLREAEVRCPEGPLASGTSTDAVVVACTGRGRTADFGGPISNLGALAARAAHRSLERGVRAWLERHR
jgi:adenosylcobinamide hydrolase